MPNWAWTPTASCLALLPAAILAVSTHRLFLFASLAPTAVIVVHQPSHGSARAYNVIMGHVLGLAAACVFVLALGLSRTPSVFMLQEVSPARAIAAVGAIGLATILEVALRAQHPPAASTTLLVALGSFHPTFGDVAVILGGVIAVAVPSELLRRMREPLRAAG